MAKRISKANFLTPTAEWRLYKAEQLRLSSKQITAKLARLTGKSEKEIRKLYTAALKEALKNDEKIYRAAISEGYLSEDKNGVLNSYFGSVAFSNALKAGLQNTNGLMRNLCSSTAASANRLLSDELDLAFMKVTSGAFTMDEAVFSAVKRLGSSGLTVVNYASGRKDKVDVAVRRAVITGIGQATANVQLGLASDMGCDLVEVTAHLGARPTHQVWQGRIFSLSGTHPKYPEFRSSTGYGTGDGLCGWNCRHSFYPYFEGLSKPVGVPFTKEENDKVYRDTQKQRAYERAIRQSKRELAALDASRSAASDDALKQKLDREFQRKAVVLKRREAKLAEHLRASGLLPDNSRVRVDGFGKSVSGKAVWAAKKQLTSVVGSGIIENNDYDSAFNILRDLVDNVHNRITDMKKPISITELPDGHGAEISKIINAAPRRIRELLEQYDVKVINTQVWGAPHYNSELNAMRINIAKIANDDRGNYKTVFHEAGHAIDYALNRISHYPGFRERLEYDFIRYKHIISVKINSHDNGEIFDKMEEIFGCDPSASSILDLFSGMSGHNFPYSHSQDYWQESNLHLEREAFAHFFEATARNDNVKLQYLKEVFPNSYSIFLKMIGV